MGIMDKINYMDTLEYYQKLTSHMLDNREDVSNELRNIIRRNSKAGYPYDNAPMERYFNTLKNDLIYQHYYHTEAELYTSVEEFAYVHYNHVRPHSYNNYKTPFEARYGAD